MKIFNKLPTLNEMIEVSGKAVLQATGHTLGNDISVRITAFDKNLNSVDSATTFGHNLSGLIAQMERMISRLNKHTFYIIEIGR